MRPPAKITVEKFPFLSSLLSSFILKGEIKEICIFQVDGIFYDGFMDPDYQFTDTELLKHLKQNWAMMVAEDDVVLFDEPEYRELFIGEDKFFMPSETNFKIGSGTITFVFSLC